MGKIETVTTFRELDCSLKFRLYYCGISNETFSCRDMTDVKDYNK